MRPQETEIRFIPNREVRRIPAGWQHPRDERGNHVPLFAEQMPEVTGPAEIAAYETTSEGTPISPAFPDTPEGRLALVRHCVEHATTWGRHTAGFEAWVAILFGEHARIVPGGTVEA